MIDIIMPCYNADQYIEETIQSVLNQTETDFKLICIDDCSEDNTYSILQQFSKRDRRIVVLKNERNQGIAVTRNRGIKAGNSRYIAFLDDDDIMPLNRLKIGKEYLDRHHAVGVVAGNYLIFDVEGNRKIVQSNRFYSAAEVRGVLPFVNIIPNGSTLIRREIIEQNNIFFHEEYGIEDYYFYAEISKIADINILPEVMLEHRVMTTQYSSVCINSKQRFIKRQEAFDQIHRLLIYNITDRCSDRDIEIYTKFLQENIKSIKLAEVLRLYISISRIKKEVKRKGKADYYLFCKEADNAMKRSAKAYLLLMVNRNKK